MSTYIDIHVIQTLPPSNVNRDDTGAPKTAVFGGVRRARVSSQAWKRAARKRYQRDLDTSGIGYRTKQAAALIGERIKRLAPQMPEDERAARAGAVLKALGMKLEPKRRKDADADGATPYESTAYLAFFSADQLEQLAQLAIETEKPTKKEAQAAAGTRHGIGISLFGRMVADDATLNVDASVQVAHALSTHAVDTEADYYTAVDDLSEHLEESGAGMIGTTEFNSSTLYRYATVNLDQLLENLGDAEATAHAASAFVQGFVTSMPSGKQNSFGNQTLPDAVLLMVRDDSPVNLVGAFETPVVSSEGGFVEASAQALASFVTSLDAVYGRPARATHVLHVGKRTATLAQLGESASLDQMLNIVQDSARALEGPSRENS